MKRGERMRHFAAILGMALASGLPSSVAHADTAVAECVLRSLRQPEPARHLDIFRRLVSTANPEMRARQWSSKKFSSLQDGLHDLLTEAAKLSEADRPAAREALAASRLTKSVQAILSLALYDEGAWLNQSHWSDLAYLPFDSDMAAKKPFLEMLLKIPAPLRAKIDADLAAKYANAPKTNRRGNSIVDWPNLTAGIKRGMDAYLRLTGDVTRPFLDRLAAGESPIQAYADVLSGQRRKYFQGSSVGDYDPRISFDIARGLQTVLRRSGKFGKDEYVSLTGSFVNGKAQLPTSDIDIALPAGKSASPGGFNFSKSAEADSDAKMRELARSARATVARIFGSKRILQPEKSPVGEERQGLLNPFVIRVYRYRMELLVYPPLGENTSSPRPAVIAIEP